MKKLLLAVGAFGAFLVGYGASSTFAFPSSVHGRGEYNGYFTNVDDTCGAPVLGKYYRSGTEAIREDVNSANEFISFIKHTKLDIDGNGSGDGNRDKTGAAFIIHTMIGTPIGQRHRVPNSSQIADWERRVRAAEAEGRVNWRTNFTFSINSYWQGNGCGSNPNDDAFYDDRDTMPSIVFRDRDGSLGYALKWECGNPVGTTSLDELDEANTWSMSGRSTVSDTTPLPGQTITFRHYIRNNGPDTTNQNIWASVLSHPSNAVIRAGHNMGIFTSGQEKLTDTVNYTIPADTAPGTQLCEKVLYDYASSAGARNGIGPPVCAIVQYNFDLTPSIELLVNGVPPGAGSVAEEGDAITFTYVVRNGGTTVSQTTNCNIYGRSVPGSYTPPATPNGSSVGYTAPATGCPRTFPRQSTTTLTAETIASAPANSTICRSLFIDPNAPAPGGVREGVERCVRVASRPYLKVYGGDVSAGGGIATAPNTCSNNTNAAIATWNKGGGSSYAGAGVQYAAFALSVITEFASAQGAGTSAAAPIGLSFANTSTNVGAGNFGGDFGTAPCITDYFAQRPASMLPLGASINVGVSPLGTGIYGRTGPTTITGGNVNPGNQVTLYIDGDVFISGNITYPGSWSYDNIPSFKLVARGNIFIAPSVTQLDGVYIAQPNGATGGTIYTCATGSTAIPLGGTLYSTCNNKLTVNGSFVAKNVEFLRTRGTVARSSAGEANNNNNIAEVFNYSPALWIPQQGGVPGGAEDYDAITSLPPVL